MVRPTVRRTRSDCRINSARARSLPGDGTHFRSALVRSTRSADFVAIRRAENHQGNRQTPATLYRYRRRNVFPSFLSFRSEPRRPFRRSCPRVALPVVDEPARAYRPQPTESTNGRDASTYLYVRQVETLSPRVVGHCARGKRRARRRDECIIFRTIALRRRHSDTCSSTTIAVHARVMSSSCSRYRAVYGISFYPTGVFDGIGNRRPFPFSRLPVPFRRHFPQPYTRAFLVRADSKTIAGRFENDIFGTTKRRFSAFQTVRPNDVLPRVCCTNP